jgi:hypothetical protein
MRSRKNTLYPFGSNESGSGRSLFEITTLSPLRMRERVEGNHNTSKYTQKYPIIKTPLLGWGFYYKYLFSNSV